jgi:hypothetical protein
MSRETIITQCPHCGNRFKAPVASAGKQATCAKCSNMFVVVEKAPQLNVYSAAKKPTDDDILSPPVQTPSYKETPIKPIGGTAWRSGHRAMVEDDTGRTPVPPDKSAPAYRILRWAADGYVILGILGMIAGIVVMASALFGSHANNQEADTMGRGALFGWGFGVLIAGTVSIAFGQALRAFRDMAINSYLALSAFRG